MMLTQYACYQHSMAIVPMYDTLGDEGIEHIVNQSKYFCCSTTRLLHHVYTGSKSVVAC